MTISGSLSATAQPHFFTASPTSDGFEVRDAVLPDRVYLASIKNPPTLRGRPVTNPLTLERINAAVDECVERALVDEIVTAAMAA
jgi:hypothetical protein